MIYFDSAASYPILPEALDALNAGFTNPANPSSAHTPGDAASRDIEKTRQLIAEAIGALPSEIIFTSGATEANNLALKSHFDEPINNDKRHLVISAIEHKCIHAIADYLRRKKGAEISIVPPNRQGIVTPEAVTAMLRDETSLVSVMHVNNELGTKNPIDQIGALCFERGIRFHSDAAQSFLKVPIDVEDMDIDYLSIAAHKVGGPKGIGALYIRDQRRRSIEPVIHGAGQEEGLRGGTLPAPLISSFGRSIEVFPGAYKQLLQADLKSALLRTLAELGVSHSVNGRDAIGSMLSLTLPTCDVAALLRETSNEFALATGSACSSKEIEASHVLTALGLSRELAANTLRISFNHSMLENDVKKLAIQLKKFSNV